VALVYYAGHGLQVDGDNYLVPVDAQITQEADVPLQAVRLADLMNALAAVPSKTRIVMLDACRNNPFSALNKTGGRGLAMVDAPNGSIISYATAPGSEAEDGDGRNSPYTAAFVNVAKEQGLPIEQAFKRVRYAVHQATDGRQTPWESSSLTNEFAFFGAPQIAQGEARVQQASFTTGAGQQVASLDQRTTRSVDAWRAELQTKSPREAYEIVVREDQVEPYQAYLDLFADLSYGPRVRSLLDRREAMIAWHEATTENTPAAYQDFLAEFPNSDYAATARRLMERSSPRSLADACSPAKRERRASRMLERPTMLGAIGPAGTMQAGTGPVVVGAPIIENTGIAIRTPVIEKPVLPIGGRPPIVTKPIDKGPIVTKPIIDKGPIVTKPINKSPIVTKPILDKPIKQIHVTERPTRVITGSKPLTMKPVTMQPMNGRGLGRVSMGRGMGMGGFGMGRLR
jgi:hypothetical protein